MTVSTRLTDPLPPTPDAIRSGNPASFTMPEQGATQASPEEALRAARSLAGHIGDFSRRAHSIRDASLSVAQYVARVDMRGYDEAMRQMERKVRDLLQEAHGRRGSHWRLIGHLRETKGSLLSYAAYIRTISEVCRKLSREREGIPSGQGGMEAFLDLAIKDVFGIETSIEETILLLDKLLALMEMQAQAADVNAEGLEAALDHALKRTRKNRKELHSRLESSLLSIREFHGCWSELTAWMASARRALRSCHESAGEEPAPSSQATALAASRDCPDERGETGVSCASRGMRQDHGAGLSLPEHPCPVGSPVPPDSHVRAFASHDAFRLADLARFMEEHCFGMREKTGGRYSKARSTSQGMKKALKELTLSVERCLALDGEMVRSLKAASEVAATVFQGLLQIENTALKTELMVMNACIHSGDSRECSTLTGSMRRLSAITSSHIRFVGDRLGKAAQEIDPRLAGPKRMWKRIQFMPAFAEFQEMDRDAWCLMESVLAEANSLCADVLACIEGNGQARTGLGGVARMKGNKLVKGSSQ